MKIFGEEEVEWLDGMCQFRHVLVATSRGSWSRLCYALPSEYETVEPSPRPTTDPVVWKHDRSKITCAGCLAVLDGAVVERVPVPL